MKKKQESYDLIVKLLYIVNVAILVVLGSALWLFYNRPELIDAILDFF